MHRLVEPALADIQKEHRDALANGQQWRCRWIVVDGYLRLCAGIAMYALAHSFASSIDLNPHDRQSLGRTFAWSVGLVAAFTAILVAIPLIKLPLHVPSRLRGLYLLALIPQAVPLAMPIGFMLGIVAAFNGVALSRRSTRTVIRAAFAGSVISFLVMGWLMPYSNQTFRTATFHDAGNSGIPRKGFAEMTLSELSRERAFLIQQGDHHEARGAAIFWHLHWSIPAAILSTAAFALALITRFPSFTRKQLMAVVCGVLTAYYLAANGIEFLAQRGNLPAIVAPWMPNVLLLVSSRFLKRSPRSAQSPEPNA